jgi:hypothetical protein
VNERREPGVRTTTTSFFDHDGAIRRLWPAATTV